MDSEASKKKKKILIAKIRKALNVLIDFSQFTFSRSVGSDSCNPKDCSTPGLPVCHQLPSLFSPLSR